MKKKEVIKLWQGKYVSVRDYEIRSAIEQGGMEITHDGEKMVLTPEELADLKIGSRVIQSKFKGTYRLADILFEPFEDDPRQSKFNLN